MSRLSSKNNKYTVFEYNEAEDRVEKLSKKLLGKYANPPKNQRQTSPIDKYKFLQFFAQGTKPQQKTNSSELIDIDAEVAHHAKFQHMEISNEPIDVDAHGAQGAKIQQKETFEKLLDVDNSVMGNQCSNSVSDATDMPREDGGFSEVAGLDTLSHSNYSNYGNEQVGIILEDDDCIEMSSTNSLSPLSDNGAISVSSEELAAECGSCGHEIDNVNKVVVVFPDFTAYAGNICKESRITFSSNSVKVEGSAVNETKETFSTECTIGDIINIQSGWFGSIETAAVHLSHKSKASTGARNANAIPGIEMLMFTVCDLHWPERQEAIKSLDVRYKDKWTDVFDSDTTYKENAFLSQKCKLLQNRYSFEFDKPFEDVIYPKGDPDAVLISKRDVELLAPETFVNDTIIDFYIKYLKNKIQPEEQRRFHFFNSFFFRKLADLDKDPSSACEGRAAFQRVRKWTRKVNIFEKDYIFIPVNYSLHWSLIVICHPGEVAYFKDDEIEKSLKVPCILHMDSIKGSHRGLKNLIQSYLCEEWKARHSNSEDKVPSKFLRLRFVPLELPQQENSFDCGLFLLHYVELFLEEAPSNFNPFKITQFSDFLNWNWFLPAEASRKRARIKKLIYEICEDPLHKEDPSADCIDKRLSSQSITNENGKETQPMFLGQTWSPTITGQQGFTSICDIEKGIENSISRPSLHRVIHCTRDPEFNFMDQCQPGASPGSFFDITYQHVTARYQKSIMSPLEEAEEHGEQLHNSPRDVDHFQQVTGLATESPTTSYASRDCKVCQKPYFDQQFSQHFEILDESMKECQSSSEVEIDEDQQLAEYKESNYLETTNKPETFSISREEFAAFIVEDSQEENDRIAALVVEDSEEENCKQDARENEDCPSSFKGDTRTLVHQENFTKTIDLEENITPIGNEVPKADEQQVVKKLRRLTPGDRKQL